MANPWTERTRIYGPPWMIIGISALLMGVVVVMGLLNHNREKKTMGEILKEKGAALIRSFEAGARTGMMGLFGSDARLQTLMVETASQPDIAYIVIAAQDGTILADTDKGTIDKKNPAFLFNKSFHPDDKPQWRMVKKTNGRSIFEVYKRFLPIDPGNAGHDPQETMRCSPGWMDHMPVNRILDPKNRPAIIIGMDVTPFEQAMAEDQRNNAVILGLIFLLSVTGVITLFWAQNVMKSRKLLQDTRAYASEIVANLPVGIVVIGGNGQIQYINTVASSLLNVSPDQKEEKSAEDILPQPILDLHNQTGPDRPVIEREITLGDSNQDRVPVTVSVTDVVNDDGQHLGFMVVLKDLTELHRLETEIKRREKMAAIGNLAAGIAHEVRNPLSSIKGYASYLGSLFDAESDNRKAADIMTGEVDRVNRVISELLEFARPSDLKRLETDIRDLIGHCLDIVSHEASVAGVSVITHLDDDLPLVMVDPDRMTQVMLNVLINAI
ncbi:MAG: PAS domain-containing protein, partial [Desulfobacteraceae bacterium]|nr:PAS domain-containing protein [Desulfobacteraceae bacterium]